MGWLMSPLDTRYRHGLCALAAVVLVGACGYVVAAKTPVTTQPATVRLALVNVPDDVLRPLLPAFEQQHTLRASIVYTGNHPFSAAVPVRRTW